MIKKDNPKENQEQIINKAFDSIRIKTLKKFLQVIILNQMREKNSEAILKPKEIQTAINCDQRTSYDYMNALKIIKSASLYNNLR